LQMFISGLFFSRIIFLGEYMFKNLLSLMLIGVLFNLSLVSYAHADSKPDKKARLAEKVKQGVNKIGTGEAARVEVKLYDGTKIKGFVKEINDDSFTVVNVNTNAEQNVPYPQVKQIKGNNLSTGAKVAIGLGILAGVLLIWLIFENYG
jgi:hypothetical protein